MRRRRHPDGAACPLNFDRNARAGLRTSIGYVVIQLERVGDRRPRRKAADVADAAHVVLLGITIADKKVTLAAVLLPRLTYSIVVPPATWLSGFGLAMVQLLMRIGAAACADPTVAVAAASPTRVAASRRPKDFMRF